MILALYAGTAFVFSNKIRHGTKVFFTLLACVVPFPFLPQLLAFLQSGVVTAAAAILKPIGIVSQVQGSRVLLNNQESLIVAEACSGYKSILIFFTLTLLASFLFNFKPRLRWALTSLAIPCAWILNLARVTLVLSIAGIFGTEKGIALWDFSAGLFFYMIGAAAMTALFFGTKKILRLAVYGLPAFVCCSTLHAGSLNYTDTSAYTFTSHESRWQTATDLFYANNLMRLPMQLGEWSGADVPISDPLPFYLRKYRHAASNTYLYLQPVFGREETAFHTAEVCYINAGWMMDERGYKTLSIQGQNLQVRYATAKFGTHRHLILYWYAWPNSRRSISDGCLMFRVSVEMNGTEETALKSAADFISELSRAHFGLASTETQTIPTPNLTAWRANLKSAGSRSMTLNSETAKMRDKSLSWILAQIVPNGIVRKPSGERRNLILSYQSDPASPDYKYVFSKSALYDNALAAIALTISGHEARAADLLSTLERIADASGDLFFSFNTHNSWPNARDSEGSVVRTGASAWAGYAVCFHLAYRLLQDPNLYAKDRGALQLLRFAESIGQALLKRQITAPGDLRKGLFTGGKGSYALKLKDGKISEEFVPGEVPWCSVEHNIDLYFFFTAMGRVSGNGQWTKIAGEIREALLKSCWNETTEQFNRGINALQADRWEALDCASWGACALLSFGEEDKAERAVKSMDCFKSKDSGFSGYKPYESGPVYEEAAAQKFYFPNAKKGLWQNIEMVWPEGTLGVGVAYWKSGDFVQAKNILKEMGRMQDDQGGIAYATRHFPFQFSPSPSAASACWFVILANIMQDPIADCLFWGK